LHPPSVRQLLRNRDFAVYWVGSTVSLFGDGVYFVALAWQVYSLSNTPRALAYAGAAWMLPQLAGLLFAGAVSDRFDRRRLMIAANALSGLAIGSIGVLSVLDALKLWQLWILVAVHGLGVAFFMPAASALVPELVPKGMFVQANALRQFVRPLALRLLGPALGGVIVSVFGPGQAFLLDAFSFLFAALTFTLIRHRSAAPEPIRSHRLSDDIVDGLRFVVSQEWLWLSLLAASAWLLIYVGPLEVLLPFLVKNQIGASARGLGFVYAAGGLGAMSFAFAVFRKGLPRRALALMYVTWSLSMFALAGLALAHEIGQAMLASFLVFGLLSTGEIVWQTVLQQRVPNQLLGRVASVDWFTSTLLVPISFVLTGPVAATLGAQTTLLAAGILGGTMMAAFIALPPIRARDPAQPQLAQA
jgi:DHA3 family tetracycline resistance protein-like MFS transporter